MTLHTESETIVKVKISYALSAYCCYSLNVADGTISNNIGTINTVVLGIIEFKCYLVIIAKLNTCTITHFKFFFTLMTD
jgi:hypothetical protein